MTDEGKAMRLKDKVAIVTGAGSGIGRATALLFATEGANVVAADINNSAVSATADKRPAGAKGKIMPATADMRRAEDVRTLVALTVRKFGRLDVVFSNAGIMRGGNVVDLSERDWDDLFAVNVKGSFLLGKHAIPEMKRSGGGSFILTASANSFFAESDIAGYCATKGAVMQLTRAMAIDHGPDRIRVNCICPGWIETPMSQPFLDENPGGREFAGKIAPIGRIGQPEDVAGVALFLASDESRFVTGAAYNVDGGWTAGMTRAIALI
ncbi:MAG: glucose 1-dehydrogenase [Chloroflexi bacterium]|nr:glucose 1-dehydrogenase [Chloroflexota bacterium]